MEALPIHNYQRDILNVNLGVVFDNKEPKGFTLTVNGRLVMMTSVATPTSFNEVIKNAVQDSFKFVHYDEKEKRFFDNGTLFDQKALEERDTSHPDEVSRASTSENLDAPENVDTEGLEVSEDTGEITEAQAKGIQADLEKHGFPFDYPPQDDYNQIPPNDIPEDMFDTLKTGSTEQPKWKPNVQRLQKVSR